ncbi:MAG: amidinotransferase [Candidatus Aegiribacteria sp.]|nr:amidinotransferase [Candidatus Aegiribacteria sp.]
MKDGFIKAEWDKLNKAVIHRPGIEMFLGLLEPYASLYERVFNRKEAIREHEFMEHILKYHFGIDVIRLGQIIEREAEMNPEIREKLIDLARSTVAITDDTKLMQQAKSEFEKSLKTFSAQDLFQVIVMQIAIHEKQDRGKSVRQIHLNIAERSPLSNLYFMRDQQFTTDSGLVLCRMAKPARRFEPQLTKFLWQEVLHVPIIHEMLEPATIEGGEWIPFGEFALVGIGDRTNRDAINQLLSLDLGYKEIGVVHQARHPLVASDQPDPMINMHLDTYFEAASSDVVVACVELIREAQVEVYRKDGLCYTRTDADTNLYDFIRGKGFSVVPITVLEQMAYAANFLCIEDGRILAVDVERGIDAVMKSIASITAENPQRYGKLYEQAKKDYETLTSEGRFFPHKPELRKLGIDAYPVVLENLTGGYGAAHCMTCALNRG